MKTQWLKVGGTAAEVYQVQVHPPAERPRKFRSIYSNHSEDTSCYVSDGSLSHVDTQTNVSEIKRYEYPSVVQSNGEESYKATLSKWRLREKLQLYQPEVQAGRSSQHEYHDMKPLPIKYSHRVSSNDSMGSAVQHSTGTDLNELLKDIDKIAEFSLAQPTISEQDESQYSHWNSQQERGYTATVKPTAERWFALAVICACIAVRSFVSVVFGQINDIFSMYFSVDANAIDWLTNTSSVITFICIVVFIFTGGRRIKLRPLCVAMTISGLIGIAFLASAMMSRSKGYGLAMVGQIILGLNNAIAVSIPPIVAATWFPRGQVASALSTTFVSIGLAEALGSYLPGSALFGDESEVRQNELDDEMSGFSPVKEPTEIIRFKLLMLFTIPAIISACIFIVAILFFKERPIHPPSEAQALIRQSEQTPDLERSTILSISRSSTQAINELAPCESFGLLRSNCFILVTFIYGIVAASASTSITLLSSILLKMNFGDAEGILANSISGNIMVTHWISFTVGPFMAGLVLDRSGKYRQSAIVSVCGVMIATIGIQLAILFNSTSGLYVTHALNGFFMGAAETTLFEIAAEITYPSPELSFASILNASYTMFFIIYPVAGRLVIQSSSLDITFTYLCPTIFNVISAFITIFLLYPTYRRQAGNDSSNHQSDTVNERSSLLRNDKPENR